MGLVWEGGSNSEKTYENAPDGQHAARCIQVVDLGTHTRDKGQYGIKEQRECLIVWELTPTDDEGVHILMQDGRPFVAKWKGTFSLNDKAKLYKLLTDWRGKPFTEDELKKFEFRNLLNATCLLSVATEQSKNGKSYQNVKTAMPLPKIMKCMNGVNPLIDFSIEDLGTPVFEGLYPWVKNEIARSHEGKRFGLVESDGKSKPADNPAF